LLRGTIAAAQGLESVEAVRAAPERVARFTAETAEGAAQLKTFLRTHVYESERLVASRKFYSVKIQALFHLFMQRPELLPASYLAESAGRPLHRQVCDYIAGMTDGFFERTCATWGI
jgi:dGTPase